MAESVRRNIPLLPLRGLLVFPTMVLHLDVGRKKSVEALEHAMIDDHYILLAAQKEISIDEPIETDIYQIGTYAKVKQMLKLPNGTIRVLVEGLQRAKIEKYVANDAFIEVEMRTLPEDDEDNATENKALMRNVLQLFEQYIKLSKKVSAETLASVSDIAEPGRLADVIASHLPLKIVEKQQLLETTSVKERLLQVIDVLNNEKEVIGLEKKIGQRVKKSMERTQKEYYLREQMKAIQKELGDKEGKTGEVASLREQIDEANMPENVEEKALKELERYEKMPASSAESSVLRNYLDWLIQLPWVKETEDILDVNRAERILDEDHYGLEKVKERVTEYLAVQQLTNELKGP
ncbi:LON peptidase substrate-binding domain-containing protein, partial [Halalkalibacterium halodurans]|uniref:LON peptidase substrate-binding domain-containing protein n=1 Tax=Halalkalibacterium halodurans TaxID=86665 RepID=UPI002E24FB02|nr:LON peptidase substrate-binding domain-containing protein [Halalkalibacterium halodurans]